MSDVINVGSLVADLDLDTSRLDRGVMNAEMGLLSVKKRMLELDDALMSGKIGLAEYTKQALSLAEAENSLNGAILAGLSATGAQAAALAKSGASWNNYASAARGAGNSAKVASNTMANGWALAGMQFGYMVDDIQYGFQSIVNNVAPLTQSLALGMGQSAAAANAWGAGVQIAAVGAYQLYRHWDDFLALLEIPTVRTEAEEMEALGDKTRKTADETDRLNKYKREQARIQAILDRRPEGEEKSNKATLDAIVEADSERVLKGIMDTLGGEGRLKRIDSETEKILKEEEEMVAIAEKDYGKDSMVAEATRKTARDHRKEEQDKVDKENLAYAKKIMVDPAKRDTLIALAEKHPTAFPDGLAGNLRAETPDARDRQQEVKDEDKAIDQMSQAAADDERRVKAQENADKQAEADRKRREREEAAERREAIANAKVDNPGIGKAASSLAAGAMTGQISPDDALQRITNTLMRNDQQFIAASKKARETEDPSDDIKAATDAEKRADVAAQAILKDAGREIKGKDLGEFPQYEMDRKATSSQQFDAAQLASRVQAGVNNQDDTKKMVEYLNKCREYLEKLAAKQAENPWAGFQEK